MRRWGRRSGAALPGVGILALLAQACSATGYTAQAVVGGARVLLARRPIDKLLADPATPAPLAERLRRVTEILTFAERELSLAPGSSYRTYADLGRPYAVWTVVAAPELTVEPLTWCFPVAGCVAYRGYFDARAAERFAARLRQKGHDTSVGGVTAYSTLGWFADPVLNTYVYSADADLAGLLFHELAHRAVYAKHDTDFSESFATAVERAGVEHWLAARGDPAAAEAYRERQRRTDELVELALACRERLAEVDGSTHPVEAKRVEKQRLLAELVAAIAERRGGWGAAGADPWLGPAPNNADLASVGAYHRLTPAWLALLAESGSWPAFIASARDLATAPAPERRARLEALQPAVRP